MHIIAGLGNPGPKYAHTRHNIGFLYLDALATELKADRFVVAKKFNAEVTQANYCGHKILLIKPQTYMNNSGQVVAQVMNFYKLLPKTLGIIHKKNADLSNILMIAHDEIDLQLGEFKIQANRSSAGHNGVKSIVNHLKTQNFLRLRIGIKCERKNNLPTDKFVLENLSAAEQTKLEKIFALASKDLLNKFLSPAN